MDGPMRLRRVINIVNCASALGLLLARLGGARVRRGPDGLLLAEGCRLPFPVSAITVGDVVITAGRFSTLLAKLPRVLRHEQLHSWQWAALGPLFLPLYAVAAAWSLLTTRNLGTGNVFERGAGLANGGYPLPE